MSAQTKDGSQTSFDRVWDIIEQVGVCMLTTQFPGGLRARPLEARPDRNAGVIWLITDKRSSKEHEIEAEHDVGLVFIATKEKAYLSLTARAQVRRDHAKAAEIWKSTDSVWWNGPDDPQCLRSSGQASDRGTLGWPRQRRGGGVRIRKGAAHGREAQLG